MKSSALQEVIAFQMHAMRREGHTPTVLRLGQCEDQVLLNHFKKIRPQGTSAATTLHGFAYSGLSVHVTDKPTGVQVS